MGWKIISTVKSIEIKFNVELNEVKRKNVANRKKGEKSYLTRQITSVQLNLKGKKSEKETN